MKENNGTNYYLINKNQKKMKNRIMKHIRNAYSNLMNCWATEKPKPDRRVLRFYAEGLAWYVDLPEWTGPPGALAMVAGADTLLAHLAYPDKEITLDVATYDPGYDFIELIHITREGKPEGTYRVPQFENFELWLCGVTKFVFGEFPNKLYFKTVI